MVEGKACRTRSLIVVVFLTTIIYLRLSMFDYQWKGFLTIRHQHVDASVAPVKMTEYIGLHSIITANTTNDLVGDQDLQSIMVNDSTTIQHRQMTHPNRTKVILFWTKWYGQSWPYMELANSTRHFKACEFTNCIKTYDRSRLDEANALVFHGTDTPNFPEPRHSWQLYVYNTMEPPHTDDQAHMIPFEGKLNFTWGYRLDSDISSLHVYYFPRDEVKTNLDFRPIPPLANRSRSVVWMVSHCITRSHREDYVKELRKYIDVDVFGKCGNLTCTESYHECFEKFRKTYKFYLSFENNVCTDYITEKLMNPMAHDIVPIVLGRGNFSRVLPAHSYINVEDYNSPRGLAVYLKYLSTNETAFNEYFRYKQGYWNARSVFESSHCELCKILHDPRYQKGERIAPTFGEDARTWLLDGCNNDLVPNMALSW